MPYLPRYLIINDDCYFHVTWQCHNKDWLLQWDWAKEIYYNLLLKYKDRFDIQFYSYSFMDNHPHLAGKMSSKENFSAFFRLVNGLFARTINKRLQRKGQVVMDRFKSPQIQSDEHMLTVMTYIDLNQYRAGKVKHPKNNDWSSFGYYAYGRKDPLLTPSPSYLMLGMSEQERQIAYRTMVECLINNNSNIDISNTYFIGDPDWVLEQYIKFRISLANIYKTYAKRLTTKKSLPN